MKRRQFLKTSLATGVAMNLPIHVNAATTMATRRIQSTNTSLGIVGFGNSAAFYSKESGAEELGRQLFTILREYGGNLIDTSITSLLNLGKWFSDEELAEIHITTGFGTGNFAIGEAQIPNVSKALGKKKFDFLHLRNMASASALVNSGKWEHLKALRDEGLVKNIGITGTRESHYSAMEHAINDGADYIQVSYNFFERMAEKRILPAAKDNGVGVITSRPFINGNYFSRVSGKPLPDWSNEFDCDSWAQFSVKWIIGNPVITCAMTETTKPHHARDNLQSGVGEIPDQAMRDRMLAHMSEII